MQAHDPPATTGNEQALRGALPDGYRLQQYEIVSVLGQGGFGITYLARDTRLQRDVAIKEYLPVALALRDQGTMVLPRSTEVSQEFLWGRERFLEEARTLASLGHVPAIVRVHDFLESNGTAYMVMGLARGEPLERKLKRDGRLPPPAVERLLHPLLDGLQAVHAAGFLHRDIKPANIIVDAEGQPTLIDFGASRTAVAGHTAAMTAVFTPGYAAAEQFTSSRQGPWTDIYGVAATLYHAITGAPPPTAFDRMVDDTFVPLGRLQPADFARGLLAGIDAGLAVRSSERPQSIAGWRSLLSTTAVPSDDATVRMTPAPPPTAVAVVPVATATPPPADRRRTGLRAAVAMAVALLLAGSGYLLLAPRPTPAPAVVAQAPAEDPAKAPEGQRQADTASAEKQRQEEEAKRQSDAELARAQAERQRAEEDAAAKRATDEAAAAKLDPETAENALRLDSADRRRLQVALSSLGFDTRGNDGVFGPRSREMISAWQKSRGEPVTGFLTGPQQQVLLREAAGALAKFDADQAVAGGQSAARNDGSKGSVAAAAPSTRSGPASDAPMEEKRFTLPNRNGVSCNPSGTYNIRIYPTKVVLQIGGAWRTLEANAAGDFGTSFQSSSSGSKLTVSGNLKTRTISVANLASNGCTWSGSF